MEVKQESTEQIILASLFINLKNCTVYSCLFHILAYRITHATRQMQYPAMKSPQNPKKRCKTRCFLSSLCTELYWQLLTVSLQFMITSPIANKSLILGTKSIIKVVLKYVRVQTCRGKVWNCLPQISTVAKHNIWPFPGPNVLNEKRL